MSTHTTIPPRITRLNERLTKAMDELHLSEANLNKALIPELYTSKGLCNSPTQWDLLALNACLEQTQSISSRARDLFQKHLRTVTRVRLVVMELNVWHSEKLLPTLSDAEATLRRSELLSNPPVDVTQLYSPSPSKTLEASCDSIEESPSTPPSLSQPGKNLHKRGISGVPPAPAKRSRSMTNTNHHRSTRSLFQSQEDPGSMATTQPSIL